MSNSRAPLQINGERIPPGSRRRIELPVTRLHTYTPVSIPVHVIHGLRPGPQLFVCAAIHGDELNGVEIIHRLLRIRSLTRIRGSLIAIPVVNVHGMLHQSRYLPDRRDLNRSFPGSAKGSLASRVADLFMKEIVSQCDHGIDLHTAAIHRTNLPQIRANLDHPQTRALASAFGVPVVMHADTRDGSLREAAAEFGISMLLYEAGEALRFDELAIRAGVRGILRVIRALNMLPPARRQRSEREPYLSRASSWIRAPESGILRVKVSLGAWVTEGTVLATVGDPFGEADISITTPISGVVIGRLNLPLVNEGDAIIHLARFDQPETVAQSVEAFQEDVGP